MEQCTRCRPASDTERLCAYQDGVRRCIELMTGIGFVCLESSSAGATLEDKSLIIDFSVVENKNYVVVTSSEDYDPLKAGEKESKATVKSFKSEIGTQYCFRVIAGFNQSVPILVPLSKSIDDPSGYILKSLLAVLSSLSDQNSALKRAISSTDHLKDVPREWLNARADGFDVGKQLGCG